MNAEDRLNSLGLTLPEATAPAGNYVPFVQAGDMVYISGQISNGPDGLVLGKLGDNMDVEAGAAAAQLCGLHLIAQLKVACGGDLSRLVRVVKLGGFVNSTDDFIEQPKVINGASDLIASIFGDAGMHTRAAVSTNSLPLGVSVEVDAIFELN